MRNNVKKFRVAMEPAPVPVPEQVTEPAPQPKGILETINDIFKPKKETPPPVSAPELSGGPIDDGVKMLANAENVVNDPIGSIVNGLTTTANQVLSAGGGSEPYFETDPVDLVEVLTEGLNVIGDGFYALDANVKQLVGLDPSVTKGLIKLGEMGDTVCDASRGDVRLTIEFPIIPVIPGTPGFPLVSGGRQFNACLDTKTARTVAKQIMSDPMKPVTNAVDCALSEMLLKPVDMVTRDLKNIVASIVRFGVKPGDIMGNAKNVVQLGLDNLLKGWAGSYNIQLNPDAMVCFQAKTSDIPYETIGIDKLGNDIIDMKLIRGENMPQTPFSRKDSRNKCIVL